MEFEDLHRRHTPEPDLVPILDALTCIIFFLIYSTTFIELTKLSLPPSVVSSNKERSNEPPVAPKFYVEVMKNNQLHLQLNWSGKSPGNIQRTLERTEPGAASEILQAKANEMMTEFIAKFANEKTVQLSLAEEANYQELITVMDGIRKVVEDIVLMSPDEVKNKGSD